MGKEDPVIGDASSSGQIIRQTLQDVDWGNEAEIMLIDLLLGTGEPQQTLLTAGLIDAVLLVTTPQDLSWLDGGRSLDLFRRHNVPLLGRVGNMASLECPHCGERIDIAASDRSEWPLAELEELGLFPLEAGTVGLLSDDRSRRYGERRARKWRDSCCASFASRS